MPFLHTTKGFLKAAEQADMAVLEEYLTGKHAALWVKEENKQGLTALHLAAKFNHPQVIERLVRAGADINHKGRYGYTPLAAAVMAGATKAIEMILRIGPKIDAENASKQTALALATRYHPDTLRLLIAAKADIDKGAPLLSAIQNGRTDAAHILIDAGAKLDIHDDSYRYPIHFAAKNGSLDIAKKLLEKGADINVRDTNDGFSPLHFAINYGRNLMVELLLENGARTDIVNNKGQTALQFAREQKNDPIIRLLEAAEKPAEAIQPRAAAATLAPAGGESEAWLRMGDGRVAHIGVYPMLERKLTEIFNFHSRERIIIAENLRTGAENMSAAESFDAIDENAVRRALDAFRSLGGQVDEAVVLNRSLKKPARLP